MDFANNIYLMQTNGTDRVLRVFTSGGVLTDTLRANLTGVDVISHIAVAPNGNIILTAGGYTSTLLVFDAAYQAEGAVSAERCDRHHRPHAVRRLQQPMGAALRR